MLSTIDPHALDTATAKQITARLDAGAFELPAELCAALRSIVTELGAGNGVTVMTSSAVLTTAQAAEILNVSRPHIVKLVDEGSIPHHKAGSHRRLTVADVLEYKSRRDASSRAALAEIQQLADDNGMDL